MLRIPTTNSSMHGTLFTDRYLGVGTYSLADIRLSPCIIVPVTNQARGWQSSEHLGFLCNLCHPRDTHERKADNIASRLQCSRFFGIIIRLQLLSNYTAEVRGITADQYSLVYSCCLTTKYMPLNKANVLENTEVQSKWDYGGVNGWNGILVIQSASRVQV